MNICQEDAWQLKKLLPLVEIGDCDASHTKTYPKPSFAIGKIVALRWLVQCVPWAHSTIMDELLEPAREKRGVTLSEVDFELRIGSYREKSRDYGMTKTEFKIPKDVEATAVFGVLS